MCDFLKVVVDGIIYRMQSFGGISRLYNEILPRMCDMDESLYITLLTLNHLKQSLPTHSQIHYWPVSLPGELPDPCWLWNPIVPVEAKGCIWHSTYYTIPEKWRGPLLLTVVDMIHELFANLFNHSTDAHFRDRKKRCILTSDAVICISETTRNDVQHFFQIEPTKIHVIPLACSEVFRQLENENCAPRVLSIKPFLLYVGDRNHYKNFDRLLQAYSRWPRRKEVSLVVVGRDWSQDEKNRLMDLRIKDRVLLFRKVDDESLCNLYNQAIAFVYPSLYEGFGIPLLEAMACGCPIVASRIPSTIEVAGECPIYFEPTEVDDLINALDVVIHEGQNSTRLQAGFERVKRYSWDKTAQQLLNIYHLFL
ncbi:MAG: hypothetical protein DRG83_20765 [Deltaproteobacteria bacterium]|nr:MAG: hypothetical protein DRG83_20765 [Deltaproteobacteria bacterium]